MAVVKIKARLECWSCKGTGVRSNTGNPDQTCPYCDGGYTDILPITLDLTELSDAIAAVKVISDKMSSNLDDIMVKLDV